ncbi:coiled-coil domain-containing protein [Paraburkholderia tropica]|uniref:hypothetical protein n=1 Tax=Paraburkholderia tropica TaxID=92647 RepID=UPI002AB76137|nr:hypothetical protein [Paraburkholderia tropica]
MSENQLAVAEAQPPQQLITIEPAKYVALVFEPFAKRLADAKTLAEAATFDVTTTAGMAVAVKHRATFRDIRVASEKARKERKAPILEIGKLLDSRQKEIEAEIEPYESRFDDVIKVEEARKEAEKQARAAAEKARVDGIRKRIAEIQAIPAMLVGKQSETIAAAVESLESVEVTLETYQEFAGEAEMVKIAAVAKLGEMLTAQLAAEAEAKRLQQEREELARLRAEADERERVAAAERAEQERIARVAREAEEARLKAEREAHEAELRRQREAEEAKLRAEREEAQRQLDAQRAEIAKQQAEITAAKAEAERIERERQAAIEAEARAKREAEEAAAQAEAARIEAERRAAEQEQIRREREQFTINGPGDVEIVKLLANHYGVTLGDAMQWMKKFDYATADEYFAAANVAANRLEAA